MCSYNKDKRGSLFSYLLRISRTTVVLTSRFFTHPVIHQYRREPTKRTKERRRRKIKKKRRRKKKKKEINNNKNK